MFRTLAKQIDGSVLEGGGQILRNSLSFAALRNQPLTITNVRHNRTPPGLKAQHATGINLVAEISSGSTLVGSETGSDRVEFNPGIIYPGHYKADPGTAGSTTLLLQISLPCLLFPPQDNSIPSTLTLRGGTNATQAPQIDYTEHIFLPFIRTHFRLNPTLRVAKRGYFPRGGGEVHVTIPPAICPLPSINIVKRGDLVRIRGKAYVARLPGHLARSMRDAAVTNLVTAGIDQAFISIDAVRELDTDVVGSGSGIVLWAETSNGLRIAGSAVGRKGVAQEETAKEATKELLQNLEHGGCVDEYLQDQIIIFMALAKGTSKVACGPLTLHTKTAIWVAEQMTEAKFKTTEENGQTIIECQGVGYFPPEHAIEKESITSEALA